jgi:hypothetical protein
VVVHVCHLSYAGSINRRIMGPGINSRPYLKNEEIKKGLGVWLKW